MRSSTCKIHIAESPADYANPFQIRVVLDQIPGNKIMLVMKIYNTFTIPTRYSWHLPRSLNLIFNKQGRQNSIPGYRVNACLTVWTRNCITRYKRICTILSWYSTQKPDVLVGKKICVHLLARQSQHTQKYLGDFMRAKPSHSKKSATFSRSSTLIVFTLNARNTVSISGTRQWSCWVQITGIWVLTATTSWGKVTSIHFPESN